MKWICILFILIGLPVIGQEGPATGEISEEMSVVLRDVRVHVVDARGNPIKGLTREDFTVSEDKAVRDLRFFEEVDIAERRLATKGNVAPISVDEEEFDPQNSRTIVILLDSSNMSKAGYTESLKAIDSIVDNLGPGDLVKLVQMDRDMTDLSPFTRQKEVLKEGLKKSKYVGAQWHDLVSQERAIIDAIIAFQEAPTPRVDPEEVREPLAKQVNRQVELKEKIKGDYYKTFYYNMMYLGKMLGHMSGSKSILLLSGGSFIETGGAFSNTTALADRLGRTLNTANTTVYTFLFKSNMPKAEGLLSMTNLGVDFNFRSLRTTNNFYLEMYPSGTNAFVYSEDATRYALNTVFENGTHVETGLRHATEWTGGTMALATSKKFVAERVGKILDASSHYYRLGYSVLEPEKIAAVRVKLTRKIPGAKLLYGKDIEPREDYLALDERERDIAMRTMLYFNDHLQDDLDCDWDFVIFQRDEGGYTIPVFGSTPLKEKPKAGYEVAMASFNKRNEVLDMVVSKVERFPGKDLFSFSDLLLTEEPPSHIKCYLRNMDTGEFSLYRLNVPKLAPEHRPTRISNLIFGGTRKDNPIPLNHTRKVVYKEGDKGLMGIDNRVLKDPFLINNRLFKARFNNEFRRYNRMSLFFHIENLPQGVEEDLNFEFLFRGADDWHPVRGRISQVQRIKSSVRYVADLDMGKLERGEYRVWVKVTRKGLEGELLTSRMFAVR
ncbi:MAG: VWA domain-containing protein [Acidobacteriota bacterium]|nr:VWA domain-containing protein [Acidobacteriota bacterium]